MKERKEKEKEKEEGREGAVAELTFPARESKTAIPRAQKLVASMDPMYKLRLM